MKGEKEGLEVLERGDDMSKPLISYKAGKSCKALTSFFEEEEEEARE